MVDENPPENQEQDTTQETETPTPAEGDQTFKTFEDALEGYKNIQGAYTKATQENKELRGEMAEVREQVQLMQMNQPAPAQQAQPVQDFETQYIQNPEQAITQTVDQRVSEGVKQATIAATLDEISLENPAEFQERYAFAQSLSNQYPQLTNSSAGVKKLFAMGDKLRTESLRKNAQKSIDLMYGDGASEKIQGLLNVAPPVTQNTNNAYMPDYYSNNRADTSILIQIKE